MPAIHFLFAETSFLSLLYLVPYQLPCDLGISYRIIFLLAQGRD